MSYDELASQVRSLEERVAHLEHFIMQSLVFRVEDLAEAVRDGEGQGSRGNEIAAHARHLADKARVSGWTDDGP